MVTALVSDGFAAAADVAVRDWLRDAAPAWAAPAAATVSHAGQGGPLTAVSLVLALTLAWRRKTVLPLLLFAAAFVSVVVIAGLPKVYFRRGAPADPQADAVEFFSKPSCGTPACQSYPSGHAANAVVWYGLIMLLLAGVIGATAGRIVRVAAAAITAVATVVSGFHWLTDTVAGLLLGVAIYLVLSIAARHGPRYVAPLDRRFGAILASRR